MAVAGDLARALVADPVHKRKVAAYDLQYAIKDPDQYLRMVSTEQLQHGDAMARDSLTPAAVAEVIASTLFAFVLKYPLAGSIRDMGAAQIQAIAVLPSVAAGAADASSHQRAP